MRLQQTIRQYIPRSSQLLEQTRGLVARPRRCRRQAGSRSGSARLSRPGEPIREAVRLKRLEPGLGCATASRLVSLPGVRCHQPPTGRHPSHPEADGRLAERVRAAAHGLGFARVGFARAERLEPAGSRTRAWLGQGRAAGMHYLETVADRVIMLDKDLKKIVATGRPRDLRDHSDNPWVRRFFNREVTVQGN